MKKNPSWIAETHQLVKEKKGALTKADNKHIREMMKIPNDDVSIEDVKFKIYHNHF